MATFLKFKTKLIEGMQKRGYETEFAEQIFKQICGFGEYGFPESHSASFAVLAYCSAWLKCYYPECFYASLLNSQPMGFYSPSQLVQDAQRQQCGDTSGMCELFSKRPHGCLSSEWSSNSIRATTNQRIQRAWNTKRARQSSTIRLSPP